MREALELTRHLASLDQGVGEDGETPLGDLLASERPEPEEEVVNALGDARIREVVGRLPPQERDVITLRFGLLGLTTERARRLEEQALGRLAESGELQELRLAA